ncbi:unnamed protein product [Phytophthora fragariaefolia]|uniref:Unnamed protein product n=1 Tax=Phytophthora fragariaefolia TaxID=1490495 RepID=A0A9W6YN92_9STRA|nr:unnamed protein product [Phytophthora fragariaefolia]
MAPADDAKAAAAEPTPAAASPAAAPAEEPAAKEAPVATRSPAARKAKTAAAKKEEPAAKEAPKAKKPKAKAAPKSAAAAGEVGPSYFELIVDAIKELKERNGSSRQAIAKVVEAKKANYASHHLNKALRTAVDAGKFVQVKGSYKLSPELRKPAASKKKSLKVSEKSAKTVKKVAKVAKKTAAKKVAATKKVAAKKAPAKKTAAKKASAKKVAAKKAPAKKVAAKKTAAKKAPAKKAASKKAAAKATKKTVKKTAAKNLNSNNVSSEEDQMTRLFYRTVASAVALTTVLSSFTVAQYSSNSSSGSVAAGVEDEDFGVGCAGNTEYPTSTDHLTMQPRYAYLVTNPLADFIAVHFKEFNLPDNDYVQVRAADPAAKDTRVLQYRGNDSSGSFFSDALSASSVIVELFTDAASTMNTANASECVGFAVDSYQFLGQGSTLNGSKEEVCGADNSQEARCYSGYGNVFQASNAVVRLLIKKSTGSFFCTGWLLGSEGHVITNHHCISTQAHARNTEFEFMAEGYSCNVNCASPRSCRGDILASYSTLIYADPTLDYALVKLPYNPTGQYGYLQLRSSGAVMNERVYVPQHPSGWGKRIAIKTDNGWGRVASLTTGGCADNQVAYYLDTQGGSSGSPVISWSDNSVIALHHCGGCPNTAINSYKLVNDMQWRAALSATWAQKTFALEYVNTSNAGTAAGVEELKFGVGCGGEMNYPSIDEFTEQPRFAYLITNPLAAFVSVHFKDFNLPKNDYVQVRPADPASSETQILQYRGNETSGSFYTTALSTSAVIVELFTELTHLPWSVNGSQCVGFSVDSYQFMAQGSTLSGSKEEVCGADNSREASCYKSFDGAYQTSNAVARLLIKKPNGSFFCTGWLLGSEGHLITNHHCISTQEHASNTEFEFDAAGSSCNRKCDYPGACKGSVCARYATLIHADKDLDYALVKLPENLSGRHGYLQLRASGAIMSERVYLPQHPAGWGKRIAMKSDSGWGTVTSISFGGCAPDQVGYYLDTQGGSSGSPLISWSDNLVVALHHCGGCPNTAINSYKLVNDMRWKNILPADAAASQPLGILDVGEKWLRILLRARQLCNLPERSVDGLQPPLSHFGLVVELSLQSNSLQKLPENATTFTTLGCSG